MAAIRGAGGMGKLRKASTRSESSDDESEEARSPLAGAGGLLGDLSKALLSRRAGIAGAEKTETAEDESEKKGADGGWFGKMSAMIPTKKPILRKQDTLDSLDWDD